MDLKSFLAECRALEQLEGRGYGRFNLLDLQNGSIGLFMIGLMETLTLLLRIAAKTTVKVIRRAYQKKREL